MRAFFGLILAGLFAMVIFGCGPAVSEEELGTVVFEVPEVPGADGPYKLPESAPPASPGHSSTPPDEGIDLPVPP